MSNSAANVNNFLQIAREKGYEITDFTPDGKIHRFKIGSRKNGWYKAHLNFSERLGREFLVVRFGDWKTREVYQYQDDMSELQRMELEKFKEEIRNKKAAEEKERVKGYSAVAASAELLLRGKPQRITPYMERKGIDSPYGSFADGNNTLIPMRIGEDIWGVSTIYPDGKKLFMTGQKFKGTYHIIGKLDDEGAVYVCEGFATGASIFMATKRPVIIAFSAGNIDPVATRFGNFPLVIAADNDQFTEGNPGETVAKAVAEKLGKQWVSPKFQNLDKKPTDFNDLHLIEGIGTVKKQLGVDGNVLQFKKKKEKGGKADLLLRLANHICGLSFEPELSSFAARLHVVETVKGEPIIYEEMSGQLLQRRNENFVTQNIVKFGSRPENQIFRFEPRDAVASTKYWLHYAPRLEAEIAPVLEKSKEGYTFHRLPWDFAPGEHPTWDEMFSRLENAEAIRAWVGSLFEPKSDRQSYCWIHGDGGDGKGAINRFLKRVFNGVYRAESVPTKGDKFWASGLLNARIVAFPDCNNYNFPTTGLFKTITGDDPIKIEFKGENAFSADLVCKLLFLSNEKANITSQRSDVRRAIFARIEPISGAVIPTRIYDQMLWDEGAAFLHTCLKKYQELCPNHGPIPVDGSIVERLTEDNEEYLRSLALKHFRFMTDKEKQGKHMNQLDFVRPTDLQDRFGLMRLDQHSRRNFLAYLERNFKFFKRRVRSMSGDELENRYVGAAMRSWNLTAADGL